jgi:hypothetical protein
LGARIAPLQLHAVVFIFSSENAVIMDISPLFSGKKKSSDEFTTIFATKQGNSTVLSPF